MRIGFQIFHHPWICQQSKRAKLGLVSTELSRGRRSHLKHEFRRNAPPLRGDRSGAARVVERNELPVLGFLLISAGARASAHAPM